MSLATDWDSAVPVGSKPDPSAEWDKAKPITFGAPAAKPKPKLDVKSESVALGEGALAMGSGMLAKPLSDVAGLAATGKEMISPTPGGGDPAGFKREVQNRFTYDPRTQWGQNVAENNPMALIAKLFGWGGGKARAGVDKIPVPQKLEPLRDAVGRGLEEGVQQAPGLVGAKFGKPVVDATAGAMKDTGRSFMQSALKPSMEAQRTGKADAAIETLLQEGVNVSRGGADKLRGRVEALDDRISKMIDTSPATIDKQHVGYRLQSALDKFEKQVTPLNDLKAIQKAWDEFLDHPMLQGKDRMTVKEAQELKRGTYKALGDKAYGELKGADMEAQKTLARGLKEEIAAAVPKVQPLNAEQSKLIGALSLVERRALMEANKNPAGLGWLTTNPANFAAWMADRSGLFKSLVARMLNSGADALPPLGADARALGAIQQGQIPPPPP